MQNLRVVVNGLVEAAVIALHDVVDELFYSLLLRLELHQISKHLRKAASSNLLRYLQSPVANG